MPNIGRFRTWSPQRKARRPTHYGKLLRACCDSRAKLTKEQQREIFSFYRYGME